ncbi:flagellar biosynthesis anti-sigma factor FlgM [Ferrimonas marina]|uniref:Negative regulator of flagellin synthesis n=1 Tax=Ferrimonas marina TaxID=299255 RepID=A0A1M5YBA9_9GAMM|nr:flagellar biosynthesis anti-sigma factor FlgM [Ferrimonas marina]SHI09266.1 anti-sigma-28 factor, FlgM family [Ferrimonas marina]
MAIDLNKLGGGAPQTVTHKHTSHAKHDCQAEAAPQARKGDEVALSSQAQQLKRAEASLSEASGIDQAKVDRIKAAIAEGQYHIDPERLAQNITRFEAELDGLSDD